MGKSITLSPKHGLNAFIPACFWCGGSKNMVAIPGRLKGDAKAQHNMVIDTEPCDKCTEGFRKAKESGGMLMFEVGFKDEVGPVSGLPPVQKDLWLTGRMVGITMDAFDGIFPEAVADEKNVNIEEAFAYNENLRRSKESQVSFCHKDIFNEVFGPMIETRMEENNGTENS